MKNSFPSQINVLNTNFAELNQTLRLIFVTIMCLTEIEKDMGALSVEILFERMMLLEMRSLVKEIGGETFAEMKSYNQPPETAVQIVDILIELFLAKNKEQFNNWNSKKLVSFHLSLMTRKVFNDVVDGQWLIPVFLFEIEDWVRISCFQIVYSL